MSGWEQIQRFDASSDALEKGVQDIFDAWGSDKMPAVIAGAPDWLWELGRPAEKRGYIGYGYAFKPDVLWQSQRTVHVAELKYGTKFEPIALAEAVHHAYMFREIKEFTDVTHVTPIVISQYNGWIRAAVAELKHQSLRHVEIDLLYAKALGGELLWVTDPHAALTECKAPKDVPLGVKWKARKWWRVTGEETWFVQERPRQPFNVGQLAIISKIRAASQGFVLWSGEMPPLGKQWAAKDWHKAGTYWGWSQRSGIG